MKNKKIWLTLLFMIAAKPASADEVLIGRKNFLALGVAYQHGLLIEALYERELADWFRASLSLGGLMGLHDDYRNSDQFGTEYENTFTGSVYPIAGAGGFLHIPRGPFRFFGIGLQVEGYYYDIRLESTEVNRKDRKYIGFDKGSNYNFRVPILSVRNSIGDAGQDKLFTYGFDLGARFGGDEKPILAQGNSGTLTGYVSPNRGIYFELLLGCRY